MKYSILLAALIVGFFSCDNDVTINVPDTNNFPPNSSNCITGEGPIVMQSVTVTDPYQRIESLLFADVFITQGPLEDIRFEGQQNILDQIRIGVFNGRLLLDLDECINTEEAVKVYISHPEIEALILGGAGKIVMENDHVLTNLEVDLEGVGDIRLRGTVDTLDIELEPGVGNILAFDMIADVCEVRLEGVGDVEVYVNDELDVFLSGTGNVYYKGNPTVTSEITGLGSVIDAN